MNLTEQGYYNAVVHVAEPEDMWELFEPTVPGEDTGRLEDVETAIHYISDTLDSDNFNSPTDDQWNTQKLLMKGYILEGIRFKILREDWEPIFKPFPSNPLKYYDPDVTIIDRETHSERFSGWVKLRQVPSHLVTSGDPRTIYIHDSRWDKDSDVDFWIDALGTRAEGDDLEQVLNDFHDQVEEKLGPGVADELGEKLAKFYEEASVRIEGI